MTSIELRGVWYRYVGSNDWVLKNVSLTIEPKEVVVITGHNGSGKTTLLKIASLIYRPTKGEVLVGGKEFWSLTEDEKLVIRRKVVYVHEKPILLRDTVLGNVAYGLRVRGLSNDELLRRCKEVLEELGIWGLKDVNAYKLSVGQAQLVAIARALTLNPEVLLLDEPYAHLDMKKKEVLTKVLSRRSVEGMTLVIATHQKIDSTELRITKTVTLENGEVVNIYNYK